MNSRKKTFFALVVISLFSFLTFAQVYFGDSDSVNYRGKREPRESGDFSVLNISTSRTGSSTVRFDILFTISILPFIIPITLLLYNIFSSISNNSRVVFTSLIY